MKEKKPPKEKEEKPRKYKKKVPTIKENASKKARYVYEKKGDTAKMWEKNRREKMNQTYESLAVLLPGNTLDSKGKTTMSKIDILLNSIKLLSELKKQLENAETQLNELTEKTNATVQEDGSDKENEAQKVDKMVQVNFKLRKVKKRTPLVAPKPAPQLVCRIPLDNFASQKSILSEAEKASVTELPVGSSELTERKSTEEEGSNKTATTSTSNAIISSNLYISNCTNLLPVIQAPPIVIQQQPSVFIVTSSSGPRGERKMSPSQKLLKSFPLIKSKTFGGRVPLPPLRKSIAIKKRPRKRRKRILPVIEEKKLEEKPQELAPEKPKSPFKVDLNELPTDLFETLPMPQTSCASQPSLSPTAAYLMTFPLVPPTSSGGKTPDDEQTGSEETSRKPDSLNDSGNMLELDNFTSFFPSNILSTMEMNEQSPVEREKTSCVVVGVEEQPKKIEPEKIVNTTIDQTVKATPTEMKKSKPTETVAAVSVHSATVPTTVTSTQHFEKSTPQLSNYSAPPTVQHSLDYSNYYRNGRQMETIDMPAISNFEPIYDNFTSFTFSLTSSSKTPPKYTSKSTMATTSYAKPTLPIDKVVKRPSAPSVVPQYQQPYSTPSCAKQQKTPQKTNRTSSSSAKYDINWMTSNDYKPTTPDFSVIPPSFDFSQANSNAYYSSNFDMNRKSDLYFAHPPDENLPWSPSKMTNLLEPSSSHLSSIPLPNLHGDLALNPPENPPVLTIPPSTVKSNVYPKKSAHDNGNFLSVRQLVDQNGIQKQQESFYVDKPVKKKEYPPQQISNYPDFDASKVNYSAESLMKSNVKTKTTNPFDSGLYIDQNQTVSSSAIFTNLDPNVQYYPPPSKCEIKQSYDNPVASSSTSSSSYSQQNLYQFPKTNNYQNCPSDVPSYIPHHQPSKPPKFNPGIYPPTPSSSIPKSNQIPRSSSTTKKVKNSEKLPSTIHHHNMIGYDFPSVAPSPAYFSVPLGLSSPILSQSAVADDHYNYPNLAGYANSMKPPYTNFQFQNPANHPGSGNSSSNQNHQSTNSNSLTNFNVSAICPEINEKVRQQSTNW